MRKALSSEAPIRSHFDAPLRISLRKSRLNSTTWLPIMGFCACFWQKTCRLKSGINVSKCHALYSQWNMSSYILDPHSPRSKKPFDADSEFRSSHPALVFRTASLEATFSATVHSHTMSVAALDTSSEKIDYWDEVTFDQSKAMVGRFGWGVAVHGGMSCKRCRPWPYLI